MRWYIPLFSDIGCAPCLLKSIIESAYVLMCYLFKHRYTLAITLTCPTLEVVISSIFERCRTYHHSTELCQQYHTSSHSKLMKSSFFTFSDASITVSSFFATLLFMFSTNRPLRLKRTETIYFPCSTPPDPCIGWNIQTIAGTVSTANGELTCMANACENSKSTLPKGSPFIKNKST